MLAARTVLVVVSAVLCAPHLLIAQTSKHTLANQVEQSDFSIDSDEPMQRPAELPRTALDALSEDKRVAGCLNENGLSAKELLSNWFVASQIHLDGPNEVDLVVLPGGRIPGTPAGEVSPNACLVGANTAQMWVLRQTQTGFQVVLSQMGLGMNVLSTRTNGLRNIQVGAVVGMAYNNTTEYRFDGKQYQIARHTSGESGAQVPTELSGYETRDPLIQLPGQTAESVRGQARAWIWERWVTHKLSYLNVKTHDDEAEETTTYYIAPADDGWGVTIQRHRILRATPTQGTIVEDDLSVATEVDRIEPGTEDSYPVQAISDAEKRPESKYRLLFLDYAERTIAVL